MKPPEHRAEVEETQPIDAPAFDCIDGPDGMTLVIDGKHRRLTAQQRAIVLLEAGMAHA